MTKNQNENIPSYIKEFYSWLYLNPKVYNLLDNAIVPNILTLGYHYILSKEIKKEIAPHAQVLQIGATTGSQIKKAYSAIGMLGSYTVIDAVPELIERKQKKHTNQHITFTCANATDKIKDKYDVIICHLLLHELPPYTRNQVLNNIIKALKSGGKAIFIDYHLPEPYHPLKYIIRAVNRLYQPFAESLWKKSIKELTPNAESCTWSLQTYFGGVYQKVVATKSK